jgi:hypothetical protein
MILFYDIPRIQEAFDSNKVGILRTLHSVLVIFISIDPIEVMILLRLIEHFGYVLKSCGWRMVVSLFLKGFPVILCSQEHMENLISDRGDWIDANLSENQSNF